MNPWGHLHQNGILIWFSRERAIIMSHFHIIFDTVGLPPTWLECVTISVLWSGKL